MRALDRQLQAELAATGVPYRIEGGKKHDKVYLGDRMIGTWPRSSKPGTVKGWANTRAMIRRAAREMKA